jgi:hypothetical protein
MQSIDELRSVVCKKILSCLRLGDSFFTTLTDIRKSLTTNTAAEDAAKRDGRAALIIQSEYLVELTTITPDPEFMPTLKLIDPWNKYIKSLYTQTTSIQPRSTNSSTLTTLRENFQLNTDEGVLKLLYYRTTTRLHLQSAATSLDRPIWCYSKDDNALVIHKCQPSPQGDFYFNFIVIFYDWFIIF